MSVIALHEHEFKRSMLARIKNFGFELEMLTPADGPDHENDEYWETCDTCEGDGHIYTYVTVNEGTDDETEEEIREYCPECRGNGGRYESNEYRGNSDRLDSLLCAMSDAGLLTNGRYPDTEIHDYHCDCGRCDHRRSRPFLTAQEDCTVGVEFITKICSVDDGDDLTFIEDVAKVVDRFHSWKADGYDNNGNHVHVSNQGTDNPDGVRFSGTRRIAAHRVANLVYATYDWDAAADGGCGRLRDYNGKPGVADYDQGGWLRNCHATFEHRLWNTPSIGERIFGHVGASIALTRWAFASTLNHPILLEGQHRVANHEIYKCLEKHRDRIITDIASYLPPHHYGRMGANVLELVS